MLLRRPFRFACWSQPLHLNNRLQLYVCISCPGTMPHVCSETNKHAVRDRQTVSHLFIHEIHQRNSHNYIYLHGYTITAYVSNHCVSPPRRGGRSLQLRDLSSRPTRGPHVTSCCHCFHRPHWFGQVLSRWIQQHAWCCARWPCDQARHREGWHRARSR